MADFAHRSDAAPVERGTLWDFFLRRFGPTDRPLHWPLARVFLSDENVAVLETALKRRAAEALEDLCPPPSMLTVQGGDDLREAVFQIALSMGYLAPTQANLLEANRACLSRAFRAVSVHAAQFARYDNFTKFGVSPADAPRPEVDRDRGDRVEQRRPFFGGTTPRPTAGEFLFGGCLESMAQFHALRGTARRGAPGADFFRTVTRSDEDRPRFLDFGGLKRHGAPADPAPPTIKPGYNGFDRTLFEW